MMSPNKDLMTPKAAAVHPNNARTATLWMDLSSIRQNRIAMIKKMMTNTMKTMMTTMKNDDFLISYCE